MARSNTCGLCNNLLLLAHHWCICFGHDHTAVGVSAGWADRVDDHPRSECVVNTSQTLPAIATGPKFYRGCAVDCCRQIALSDTIQRMMLPVQGLAASVLVDPV